MTHNSLGIRTAQVGDLEEILDLLEPQEFVKPLTREQLRRLFAYPWRSPDRGMALLLTHDNAIVGVGITIYAPARVVDGTARMTVNVGMLFVRSRYRARRTTDGVIRYSEELIRAVLTPGAQVVTFSAHGPDEVVPRILSGLGFEEICSADFFYPFGSHAGSLLRPNADVVSATSEIQKHLNPEQLTVLRDHEPYDCRFMLLREGDRTCFLVTKRRRYRGEWLWPRVGLGRIRYRYFPVTDVLHVSDPAVAVPSWGRMVALMSLRDRTVGVTCTQSFLGPGAREGTRLPQRVFAYGVTRPASIDKLYSEQVLLP